MSLTTPSCFQKLQTASHAMASAIACVFSESRMRQIRTIHPSGERQILCGSVKVSQLRYPTILLFSFWTGSLSAIEPVFSAFLYLASTSCTSV